MTGRSRRPAEPLSPPIPGEPYRAGALVVLMRLRWFIHLRWIFVAVAFGVLTVERFLLPANQRPWELLIVVLGVAGVNVVWMGASRLLRRQLDKPDAEEEAGIRSSRLFANAQVATDLLLLTGILRFTGGVENPACVFYLFHVAISALLLKPWHAVAQSCWAFCLYTAVCVGEWAGWLEHYAFLPQLAALELHDNPHYVPLGIAVMATAIFATLYFTVRIGKVLDRREDELRCANIALKQSQLAIQDLQLRRSRFMQTAAHQLKSPLAMVQTLANLIRDGIVQDPDGIQATCDKIVHRAREGIVQVTELLALARVQETDPARHRAASSDIAKVVGELCQKYAPTAQAKQLDFTWQLPEQANVRAHVHPADLADCVGNLIDNAIKYTPQGGSVKVTVVCGVKPDAKHPRPAPQAAAQTNPPDPENHVYVIVKDTGIGLGESTPSVKDGACAEGSIFDAFRRGNLAIKAGIPGSGLGLSIVREIVEQAGGYIHVYSRAGQGSTFTVSFPAEYRGDEPAVRDTRSSHIILEPPAKPAAPEGGAVSTDADSRSGPSTQPS